MWRRLLAFMSIGFPAQTHAEREADRYSLLYNSVIWVS